jgi:proliferating cell nuclear antigen PCNA
MPLVPSLPTIFTPCGMCECVDRTLALGIKLESMAKILKCSGNDDMITLKTEDDSDSLTFMFESPSQDRISDFELRLMAIDSEHLGIPDTEYTATIKMPASEFQRITRDLQIVGDTVKISCSKDGVKFSVVGDLGSGNTMIRQSQNADKPEDVRSETSVLSRAVWGGHTPPPLPSPCPAASRPHHSLACAVPTRW